MNPDFCTYQTILVENPPIYEVGKEFPDLRKVDWWHGFVSLCIQHAANGALGEIGKVNLVAVHPYHSQLGPNSNKPKRNEIATLEHLLQEVDSKAVRRILFDSYVDYGKKSHELVDKGLIDKVIFTFNDSGVPLFWRQLQGFADSKLNYFGGSYGGKCLGTATAYIRLSALSSRIIPIRDAILYQDMLGKLLSFAEVWHSIIAGADSQEVLNIH